MGSAPVSSSDHPEMQPLWVQHAGPRLSLQVTCHHHEAIRAKANGRADALQCVGAHFPPKFLFFSSADSLFLCQLCNIFKNDGIFCVSSFFVLYFNQQFHFIGKIVWGFPFKLIQR